MRPLNSLLLAASLSFLVACGDTAEAPSAEPEAAGASAAPAKEAPAAAPDKAEAPAAEEAHAAPAKTLSLSPASKLGFVARKNDEADVAGTFTKLSGELTVPGGDLSGARGNITISWIAGVETGDAARDSSLVTVFFGAFDANTPKGQVSLNSLEVETPKLAVGASTSGNAFVDVGAGMAMMGLAVPVKVTRDAEDAYTVSLPEGAEVSINKLGMGERKATLMQVCAHKSVGDTIKISGSFTFGK